ncbi:ATP-binding protein [Mollicutes bacterium LVI A0039]|nr:ATP-binding protein [Mollicutes bacterium LVI A0039]
MAQLKLSDTNGIVACNTVIVDGPVSDVKDIERSIIKKFRKQLWTPFIKGVKEFEMIADGDRIAVCISGGKDSLLLAKLLQEMQKHSTTKFELEFIAMNPGFNDANYEMLVSSCKDLGIEVDVFKTEIFAIVEKIAKDYPCYMCARMRRGALYEYAQSKGCNKIALGHHYTDFNETVLMNVLYGGNYKAMMPKVKAKNYDNMELIRPMVYVHEDDIIRYTKHNNIRAMNCGCVVAANKTSSKRAEVKQLIKDLKTINPDVEKSIFASTKNVTTSSILGWNDNGHKTSFLDEYNN